jgi:hypothetical protein
MPRNHTKLVLYSRNWPSNSWAPLSPPRSRRKSSGAAMNFCGVPKAQRNGSMSSASSPAQRRDSARRARAPSPCDRTEHALRPRHSAHGGTYLRNDRLAQAGVHPPSRYPAAHRDVRLGDGLGPGRSFLHFLAVLPHGGRIDGAWSTRAPEHRGTRAFWRATAGAAPAISAASIPMDISACTAA